MRVVAQRILNREVIVRELWPQVIINLRGSSWQSVFSPGELIRGYTLPGIEPTTYKCDFVK